VAEAGSAVEAGAVSDVCAVAAGAQARPAVSARAVIVRRRIGPEG
jgi:hypothetical protein